MNFVNRTLRSALRALQRNVTRSVLTCLGIVIGVAAVIAMMEIGAGSSEEIQKTIAKMGANVLMIFPGQSSSAGVLGGGTFVADGVAVFGGECDAAAIAEADAGRGGLAGEDHQNIGPHFGDGLLNFFRGACADLHHRDDGGDADDDAEARKY